MAFVQNHAFVSFAENVQKQGDQFVDPISPDGTYYAFLAKVDLTDPDQGVYELLFEIVRRDWVENALPVGMYVLRAPKRKAGKSPKNSPALLYRVAHVSEATLLKALGLNTVDDLAEGSWYLLKLGSGKENVFGVLYDPDLDTVPKS